MDHFRKRYSEYSSIAVIAAVVLCFFIMNDTGTTAALRWLAVVFSVSFFMHPYMNFTRLEFFDGGFGLSFGAGIFLCFYLAWVVSASGFCGFSDAVVFASFATFAVLGYVIKRFVIKEAYISGKRLTESLRGFAIFAVVFLTVFYVIGFNPLVDPGTENYMDFGFMQTIYRQKSAIPMDFWFSGTKLNYYYLGQAVSVYMCRLAVTTPEYGYNMMLATFAGMVFLMCAELAGGISGALINDFPQKKRYTTLAGIFAGMIAAFSANGHWIVYGVIPFIRKTCGFADSFSYWFSDPTVYINTSYGDPDNGKNEFPAYSFILGDLHAHVINVIFVLPLVGLLFDLVLSDDEDRTERIRIWKLVLISMMLAYYKGANYWDFAIYYVITGALIVFTRLKKYGFGKRSLSDIAFCAIIVTAVSMVAILPFTMNFVKMESGIGICDNHTPLVKFAVLWAIPLAVTIWLIVRMYVPQKGSVSTDPVARCALLAFCLCTIGLTIVPEIVYVKDIYGDSNQRFNTMFKLTYQAFVLFALITGVAFGYIMCRARRRAGGRKHAMAAVICIATATVVAASYTPYSIYRWFGNVFDASMRKGISSLEGLRNDEVYGFEMTAYDELSKDGSRIINIVEAAGESYNHYNALSVYSGACTPSGWFTHEWMWHNDSEPVSQRSDSVRYFYESADSDYCRRFLKEYDIDYIFVGPAEVCRYPVYREGFEAFGDPVASTVWQGVILELIKVDKSRL